MSASKVYYTDMTTRMKESQPQKLERLIKKAGLDSIDFKDKFVAIKIHFGELGNVAYLRHNWARTVVEMVKARGGHPFLTDCNTLYVGSRTNALDHLDCARLDGYCYETVGCNIIIADGLRGTEEREVPINCEYVKSAKIGSALMDADIVISLSHFKGHEAAGFGGAVKNLGMGGGSRAGKMEMHYFGKPHVEPEECIGCGYCAKQCGQNAIDMRDNKAFISDRCAGCGRCIGQCRRHAIVPTEDNSTEMLSYRMAEYTYAVVKDRPSFHINFVTDVSPLCDCYGANDVPIVPDIGMFASFDPVALDHACADMVNAATAQPDSELAHCERHGDHFSTLAPVTDWHICLKHCEKIGVGNFDYELETMK